MPHTEKERKKINYYKEQDKVKKSGRKIFALQEPSSVQLKMLRKEELVQNPQALQFAFGLELTADQTPNKKLKVDNLPPFHKIEYNDHAVIQYKINPNSASQGLVILPSIDLKTDSINEPVRLELDKKQRPILLQMGPGQIEMALASRANYFLENHNPKIYAQLRNLMDKKTHTPRTNTRSSNLEKILDMTVTTGLNGDNKISRSSTIVRATSELAYTRISSLEKNRSRNLTRENGLFINTRFGPMSILGLGAMPPVGGSRDMLVLSALGYGQCWIPRNGIFADNFDLQMQLFRESTAQIQTLRLDKDIENLCLSRIGLSIGCENPELIAQQAKSYQLEGGKAIRIYTTNPDKRIIETAQRIRENIGEDMMIAVGPVTDTKQARTLREKADANMFIIGHGGGENCTSLGGGGAANSLSILYELYLDKNFNDRLLFLEGGVGENYGPLLGLCDGFFMNKKALGGIESTSGLYVAHSRNKKPCLPYHGSASPGTQLIEAYLYPTIANRRLNKAGLLNNNEGQPNYYYKPDWVHSSADSILRQKEIISRTLADQGSDSIYEHRQNIALTNDHNIVYASSNAIEIARAHIK